MKPQTPLRTPSLKTVIRRSRLQSRPMEASKCMSTESASWFDGVKAPSKRKAYSYKSHSSRYDTWVAEFRILAVSSGAWYEHARRCLGQIRGGQGGQA